MCSLSPSRGRRESCFRGKMYSDPDVSVRGDFGLQSAHKWRICMTFAVFMYLAGVGGFLLFSTNPRKFPMVGFLNDDARFVRRSVAKPCRTICNPAKKYPRPFLRNFLEKMRIFPIEVFPLPQYINLYARLLEVTHLTPGAFPDVLWHFFPAHTTRFVAGPSCRRARQHPGGALRNAECGMRNAE